jgi:hypothetical protein
MALEQFLMVPVRRGWSGADQRYGYPGNENPATSRMIKNVSTVLTGRGLADNDI